LKTSISVEVSPGELVDKITILEIKLKRIEDADKLANVKLEWETLCAARDLLEGRAGAAKIVLMP
jgi:hypothetical protein